MCGCVAVVATGIVIGAVLDWMGPRFTVFWSGVLMVAGSIVFGYEISFIIGYALWAVGGMGVLISAFRVGFVYPKKMNMIIGAVSCLFDTSSVVFLFFAMLNELPGLTLRNLCIGFGVAAIICYGAVVVGWSLNKKMNDGGSADEEEDDSTADSSTADDEEAGRNNAPTERVRCVAYLKGRMAATVVICMYVAHRHHCLQRH